MVCSYKTANKCYATIARVMMFLKEKDETVALLNFLNHTTIGVRMWAATYLLPVKEEDGIKVLEQISGQSGIHSFTAKTTLSGMAKWKLEIIKSKELFIILNWF